MRYFGSASCAEWSWNYTSSGTIGVYNIINDTSNSYYSIDTNSDLGIFTSVPTSSTYTYDILRQSFDKTHDGVWICNRRIYNKYIYEEVAFVIMNKSYTPELLLPKQSDTRYGIDTTSLRAILGDDLFSFVMSTHADGSAVSYSASSINSDRIYSIGFSLTTTIYDSVTRHYFGYYEVIDRQLQNSSGNKGPYWYFKNVATDKLYSGNRQYITDTNIDNGTNYQFIFPLEDKGTDSYYSTLGYGDYGDSAETYAYLYALVSDKPYEPDKPNPPGPSGTDDETQGGNGDGIPEMEWGHVGDLPLFDYNGFITVLNPNGVQMGNLMNYLWSTSLPDIIYKQYANPMDLIISAHVLPIEIPNENKKQVNVSVGGLSTGVVMDRPDDTYFSVKSGVIKVPTQFDNWTDYELVTIELFLPFLGNIVLDTKTVFNNPYIEITYKVDIVTGSFNAIVAASNSEENIANDNVIILSEQGGCFSTEIPMSSSSYSALFTVASEVISRSFDFVPSVNSFGVKAIPSASMKETYHDERLNRDVTSTYTEYNKVGTEEPSIGNIAANSSKMVGEVIENSITPPTPRQIGGVGNFNSLLSTQEPYLLIHYPTVITPDNANELYGYPTFKKATLGDLSGYVEVFDLKSNFSCLDEEVGEIIELLKQGVYV